MIKNRVVKSLCDVDYTPMKVPAAVVYKQPLDYTRGYVVRVWEFGEGEPKATNVVILRKTLEECRTDLSRAGFHYLSKRNKIDVRAIVETWMKM